jgi:hypothetical protein
MSLQLTEPLVAALVARLGADGTLNGFIDTFNAELADPNTVPYPEHVLDHFPPLAELTVFPTIGVAEGPGSFTDDIGSSATGRYQLSVHVYLSEADQQTLVTKLRRLRTAVARCVLEGRTLPTADGTGTAAWGVRLVRLNPGEILGEYSHTGRITSFLAWCGLTIECEADENT